MGVLAVIGASLLQAVLPTVATVISGYVLRLLHVQLKKAKIELTADQEQAVADLVEHAVLVVEERARRSPNMRGEQKAAAATQIVLAAAPDLPPQVVRQLIDATLPKVRAKLEAGQVQGDLP
jgi:hypothetical protein